MREKQTERDRPTERYTDNNSSVVSTLKISNNLFIDENSNSLENENTNK